MRCEMSRHFKNKKKEYLRDKMYELLRKSKNKNIRDLYRGINYFKRGYQPRCNLVKDENVDLLAIAKLKRFKSPGSDQIPAELIQAGGEILYSKIHKLIKSIWNEEELPDQWKESIIVKVQKKGDKTDLRVVIIVGYHCYQLHTKFYPIFF
jgi:hypothetical protein